MTTRASYTPQRGDIVWLDFTPQAGHEQAGRRPAVVISPGAYNGKVGLALLCPVTNQCKGYPFEVSLPPGLPVQGVILTDQVKSLDWQARRAEFVCRLSQTVLADVLLKLALLIQV